LDHICAGLQVSLMLCGQLATRTFMFDSLTSARKFMCLKNTPL